MSRVASELVFEELLAPKFRLDFSFPGERLAEVITEATVHRAVMLICLAGF